MLERQGFSSERGFRTPEAPLDESAAFGFDGRPDNLQDVLGEMLVDDLPSELIGLYEERRAAYEPLDVSRLTQAFRHLTPEEAGLPSEERRQLQLSRVPELRERAAELRRELVKQQLGLSRLAEDFIRRIEANPEVETGELLRPVIEAMPELRLGTRHVQDFLATAERYRAEHEDVAKLREKGLGAAEVFAAVAGQAPKGDVHLE